MDVPATRRASERAAIAADARLYTYRLWNNRLPSWASASTIGRLRSYPIHWLRDVAARIRALAPTPDSSPLKDHPPASDP